MNSLVSKVLEYQIKSKYICEQEKDIYQYAYLIFFEECINLLVAIIIGCFFGEIQLVVCFLCSYIPLRRYSGGYHADKGYLCGIVSAILIIFLCMLNKMNINMFVFQAGYIFLLILQISICGLAPVDSKNKRLSKTEKRKYRKITTILLVLQIMLMLFGLLLKVECIYWGIIYSHIVLCFMMFVGICKNHYIISRNLNE